MRLSAKAFLVDPDGRVLLLDCVDPARPDVRWWELPGGGVEPGESELDALVREVLEETGLAVGPNAVGPLAWTQESTFLHRGERRFSRCHGYLVRAPRAAVGDAGPSAPALTEDEQDTILGARWFSPDELAASGDRFFPRRLPELLPQVLAGDRVDEDFDAWD